MKNKLVITALTAVAYMALFELNTLLFSSFSFSSTVDWIYLPSGLRFAFALVFGVWGALGCVLAAVIIDLIHYFNGNVFMAITAGLLSGIAPLFARAICFDKLGLKADLMNLTPGMLFKASVIFAVISATLHQLWYTFRGLTENFVRSTAVMAIGDLLGTIVVLYAAKYLLQRLPVFKEDWTQAELK